MAESVPNLKPGDWLQHEALHGGRNHRVKRGEVVSVSGPKVLLYLDGELDQQSVESSWVTRWWNLWLPQPNSEDVQVPPWIAKGESFRVKTSVAIIQTVKDSWVSYLESCDQYQNAFHLVPYREFVKAGWQSFNRRSVWEWLRHPLV